uniref:si:ch211-85n16.3 isoform 2 n=1 Tax=Danio rerio TaxID=7955 RepID=UPI003F754755
MDHVKWHRRASMLYAMEETTSTKNSDEDTTIVEKRTTAFTETTVIQRAGTVEYHTRLLNPFRSRNDSPPENKTDDEELK